MATARPNAVEDEISNLRGQVPRKERMTLVPNNQSVQQTIMKQAIEDADVDVGDKVDQWWLPEQEFVVIDLSGGGDERK